MKKTIKNDDPKGPKVSKKLVILGGIGALILLGLFLKKNSVIQKSKPENSNAENQIISSDILIAKYKKELPELKKKATGNNPADLQNYAVAQYETGDLSGAEETYRKQVDVEKDSVAAHNNLANALRYQGKFDEAVGEYREVIKIAPNSISSYSNLANLYQFFLGKNEEAVNVYQEAIAQNKDSVDAYVLLANVYESSGDSGSARDYFQKALAIQPENVAAIEGLARLTQ
jgi:tetratricopeptide (TPR) repeat protein